MRSSGWTGLAACVLAACAATGAHATADASLGARLYAERCSACHGDEGRGDGPTAPALQPKPRNFHDPALWAGRTVEQLGQTVRQGKPGTMMPPFEGVLDDAEIDAVVRHLLRFKPGGDAAR